MQSLFSVQHLISMIFALMAAYQLIGAHNYHKVVSRFFSVKDSDSPSISEILNYAMVLILIAWAIALFFSERIYIPWLLY